MIILLLIISAINNHKIKITIILINPILILDLIIKIAQIRALRIEKIVIIKIICKVILL